MESEASSRDLLRRFAGSTTLSDCPSPSPAEAEAVDGGELSLGLSLGGRFSSNPREKTNMLIRSSSISSLLLLSDSSASSKDDSSFHVARAPLHRTCSLPVPGAADEDHRKRKEMQTLKRLEAKRKRSEKRGSLRDSEKAAATWLPPVSQQRGSIGSVGSSSSGGGSTQGFDMVRFSNISDAKSSSNILKMETRGIGVSEMEEMPCVSTTGNSPNGKRVEGFLYKYRKGEEVRIVCVCHGSFLTPAEFVRHAGLGDVDHPLRHIVVNPPSPFL